MPLPIRSVFVLSDVLLQYFLLTCIIFLTACGHEKKNQISNEAVKTKQINAFKKERYAPPKVIFITSANQPKIVKAGKPTIIKDSLNGGTPFFTNYGTDQGLPISVISSIIQDNSGNIWFGTPGAGAVRYDGKTFTTYTTAQGLIDDGIRCMMQDRAGNIWFGSGGGVSKYDGKVFTNFSVNNGLANEGVFSIAEDTAGNIWFGTNGGASRYDGKTFTNFHPSDGLANNDVTDIIRDKKGNIWLATDEGASRYDGKTFTNYTKKNGLAGNFITKLMQDNAGNIWLATSGEGVSRYDGSTFTNYTKKQGLAGNDVISILQDKAGNIWFGTRGNGISRYDGKVFTNYTTSQGLVNNNIAGIMLDKAGIMWFATPDGTSRYDGKSITNYSFVNGSKVDYVWSVMNDNKNNIWLGTVNLGAMEYDGKAFLNYTTTQNLISEKISTIAHDAEGNIWFCTLSGVCKFDGKQFIYYTAKQGLISNNIISAVEDKIGNIWFSTLDGLSKFDGHSFTNYTTAQGLISNEINFITIDKAGNLWFGTHRGASKYDGKSFTNYTTEQGLPGNNIYCIEEDKNGNIWFGTDGKGASKYDGKTFTNYTTANGLGDNEIYMIKEDTKRNILWFGTNFGLTSLKEDSAENHFEIFNTNTGYPIKDINTNAMIVDKDGILWAGCGDERSLIRFDYDALNKDPTPLKLQIEDIKVNGETMCWNNLLQKKERTTADSLALINEMVTAFGKVLPAVVLDSLHNKYSNIQFDSITPFYSVPVNLVIPYEDRNLTFDFAALEPDKPKQVKYQYMLEGYDKDWSPQSNNTTAVFGNIPQGNYTFKLKALSPYGVWSQTEYKFKVLAPWWKTWWAYAVYLLCFAVLIFLGARAQQRRLLYKERERNKLRELEMQALRAQMNPHFIFNCLSSINRFVLMNETEAASDYLTKFSRLIRTVLNNSKKSLISLEDELDMLRLYLDMENLRFNNGFDYSINMNNDVDPKNICIPPLLFQPFAENAVWHGLMHKKERGHLKIKLHVQDNLLLFAIEDNGVGRKAASSVKSKSAEKNKSLGLQITKERLSLINSYADEETFFEIQDLYDESGNAAGTKVLLKIKYSETTDG